MRQLNLLSTKLHPLMREKAASKQLSRFYFFLIAWFAMAGLLPAQETKALTLDDFQTQREITYKTVAGKKLDLVLFLPPERTDEKMPVMIFTHGGGWRGGNILKIFKPAFSGTLQSMLDQGIACAAVKYRLTRNDKSTAVECVQDCKDAARFLVKNAEQYGLDSGRMGVWGGSAGGHLSLLTGLADNNLFKENKELAQYDPEFSCIVSYYPLTSFLRTDLLKDTPFEDPERIASLIGGTLENQQEAASLLSPTEHVVKDSPPVLLLHGDRDKVLPISQSTLLLTTAKDKEANVRLITVKGGGHSFQGKKISPNMEKINRLATDFIVEHLKR